MKNVMAGLALLLLTGGLLSGQSEPGMINESRLMQATIRSNEYTYNIRTMKIDDHAADVVHMSQSKD